MIKDFKKKDNLTDLASALTDSKKPKSPSTSGDVMGANGESVRLFFREMLWQIKQVDHP